MSLKAFHLIFLIVSTLALFLMGAWAGMQYRESGGLVNLGYCVGCVLGGVGLVVYGRYFLIKLKDISYL